MYRMAENDFMSEDKIKNENKAVKKIDDFYDRVSTMIHQVSIHCKTVIFKQPIRFLFKLDFVKRIDIYPFINI